MRTLVTVSAAILLVAVFVIAAGIAYDLTEARMERDDAPDLFEPE